MSFVDLLASVGLTTGAEEMPRPVIVLDTETTGFSWRQGHRIIEIAAIEICNTNGALIGPTFHTYLQPDRYISSAAVRVHGITHQHLNGKPRFGEIAQQFCDFIGGSVLLIHNAPFDVGFIDNELSMLSPTPVKVSDLCTVVNTLAIARQLYPGQKNGLNPLCSRYGIDNSHRNKHGALIDAQLLAQVCSRMDSVIKELNP